MTKQIFKTILAGLIGGVALFILPFVLVRLFIFFALMSLAFKLIRGKNHHHQFAYDCRNMTEEQKAEWMKYRSNRCGYPAQNSNEANQPQTNL